MDADSCNDRPTEKKQKFMDSGVNEPEGFDDSNVIESTENGEENTVTNNGNGDANEDEDIPGFAADEDVSDMLDEVSYSGTFPTITERYFTSYYQLDVREPGDDIRILVHSNRICMLCLAPSHAVLQDTKKIAKIDFKISEKLDRSRNKVSGKSKHGAQPLQGNSTICTISTSDGKTYSIKCCMNGKLVEVNEMLLENPELLLQPPHRGGYLAIILPNIKLLDQRKETLLTEKQYEEAILQREKAMKS